MGGFLSKIRNGVNTVVSNWSPTTFIEKANVALHQTITGTAGFLMGVAGQVRQAIGNAEKIMGGLTKEQLEKALGDEATEMIEYLKSPEGMQDLALSLGLAAAMAVPGVNVVAGAVGGAVRAAGVVQVMAEAGAGLADALNGITGPMSPAQIKAAQEKLARVLAKLGVGGVARLLGKKGRFEPRSKFKTTPARSSDKKNAIAPVKIKKQRKAKAKSKCPCATKKPVIIATGEKMLEQADFSLPGPIELAWQRHYRSGDGRADGWFGQGWSHPLACELWLQAEGLQYFDSQGRAVDLPLLEVGSEHFDAYEQFTLSRPSQHCWELRVTDGQTQHFHRLAAGQWRLPLNRISDRNGNAITLWFEPADHGASFDPFARPPRPVGLTDSAGCRLRLAWTAQGQLEAVSVVAQDDEPATATTTELARYTYAPDLQAADGLSNLVRHTNPLGQSRAFEWQRHLLVGYTLASGQRYRNEYDQPPERLGPSARVSLSEAIDDGVGLRFGYVGKTTWTQDFLGRRSAYLHDERQDIVAIQDALGQVSETPFDANGHPKGSTDALGRSTSTVFDRRGNLTQVIDAAGSRTQIDYNELDLPVKLTDAMGSIWLREYDARGNLIQTTDPLGQTTRYEVDARGNVTAITDALGKRKILAWDAQGNLTRYTDCSGRSTHYHYDALGHLSRSQDALGQITQYRFDPLGRLREVQGPDDARHRYEWDGEGNLIRYTDPLGQATGWRYNGQGEPLVRTDVLGQTIRYHYDAGGRLVRLVNEAGASTHFRYDLVDRLTDEIGFDGRWQRYVYNAAGELTHWVEAGGSDAGPGKATRFERDMLGRLVAKRHEGVPGAEQYSANAHYAYDKLGRLTLAANALASVQFAYDPLGQLLSETQQHTAPGGKTYRFAHSYDPLGNRIGTQLPDGGKLGQLFYGSGHLHQISLDGHTVSDFERDALHRETSRTQGLLVSQFAWDPASRLKAQRTARSIEPGYQGISPSKIDSLGQAKQVMGGLIERSYAYDPAGQLRQILDKQRGLNRYGYDPLGRITRSQIGIGRDWGAQGGMASEGSNTLRPAADETFGWDAASNPVEVGGPARDSIARPSLSTTSAQGNRLTVWQDCRFEYDIHGNLIGRIQGKRGSQGQSVTRFIWDEAHQLVQAEVTRGVDTETSKAITQTFGYGYDALGRRIFKQDAFGTSRFAWDGDQLHSEERGASKTCYLYEPGSFVPLAQLHDGRIHHIHTDHLGTPLEATNEEGEITWKITYKTWGSVVLEEVSEIQQNLRFQGQYFDAETGLHYNRFRYYDPNVGRFISQDPIGLFGGSNLFTYAPSPTNWIDPSGLNKKDSKCSCNSGCPPGMMDPQKINFSQRSVSSNVDDYVRDMEDGNWDWNRSGPLRVMKMKGKLVSYDNRRLLAARISKTKCVPVQEVSGDDNFPESRRTWRQKFRARFNDPRNNPSVPWGGINENPTVVRN